MFSSIPLHLDRECAIGTYTVRMNTISVSFIVMRVGAIIALPLAILVPIAVVIDRTYSTLPFLTIGSLLVSACVSSFLIIRLVRK